MNGTSWRRKGVAAAATLALVGVAHAAPSGRAGWAASPQQAADPATEPTTVLVGAWQSELGGLPGSASSEDMEASLVYVLSQEQVPEFVAFEALDRLEGTTNASLALKIAIGNVRASLRRKQLRRGTAALGGSGFDIGFTAPISSIGGGGSSNYVR